MDSGAFAPGTLTLSGSRAVVYPGRGETPVRADHPSE